MAWHDMAWHVWPRDRGLLRPDVLQNMERPKQSGGMQNACDGGLSAWQAGWQREPRPIGLLDRTIEYCCASLSLPLSLLLPSNGLSSGLPAFSRHPPQDERVKKFARAIAREMRSVRAAAAAAGCCWLSARGTSTSNPRPLLRLPGSAEREVGGFRNAPRPSRGRGRAGMWTGMRPGAPWAEQ